MVRLCFVAAIAASMLTACQTPPTKVYQTAKLDKQLLVKNASSEIKLDDSTIVIDVRSAFNFATSHIPGSVNLSWQEFAQPQGKYPGRLTDDLSLAARRLSLLGINPQSKVVVVGNGLAGNGEEGRMAWTLFLFGINDVQVAAIRSFKTGLTNSEPEPRANAERWTISVPNPLIATSKEIRQPRRNLLHVIDVRTRAEFFGRKGGSAGRDVATIHIPWVEFYNSRGRPEMDMRQRLAAVGIQPKDRVIVISNQGLRSGAVAFALMSMGFNNVANAVGGYKELTNEK